MIPMENYRGPEMSIEYSIVPSPLGRLLVAATSRSASAVYFGESDAHLESSLRRQYPGARISRDEDGFAILKSFVGKILAYLHGRETHLDLPTDVAGTAFELRVWEELRRIPYGATRTYSEIARAIGQPSAVRAVARACAANPVALVVPCHRVIRADGRLAGYRGGIKRKRALLEMESGNLFDLKRTA